MDATPTLDANGGARVASELVDELVRVAALTTGTTEEAIRGETASRRGRQDASLARQAIYFALRKSGWQYEAIAQALNRNHATVYHGVERVEHAIKNDRDAHFLVGKLTEVVESYSGRMRTERDVRASIDAMDRELAWARQLALELTQRIDALTAARGALMQVVDPVPTRGLQAVV